MEQPSQSYEVNVGGLSLRLKTSHDEGTVQHLVQLVNDKINQSSGKDIPFQSALILACFSLAEELSSVKNQALDRLTSVESRARRVLTNLEASPINKLNID